MAKRPGPGPDDIDADLLDPELLGPDQLGPDLLGPDRLGRDAPGDGAIAAALTDEIDLHTFLPRDCADVVAEYLRAAQEAGMARVRIVHGKGTGALRRIVHAVLDRHPTVRAYRLADEHGGSWGATLVELHPPPT
jgi:hypothetical protein